MKKFRKNQRGAAAVEAVIGLPVFVIVFLGLFYVRDQAIATQQAEQQARSCAWLYSAQDCEGAIPAGCDKVLARADAPDMAPPDLKGKLDDQLGRLKQGQDVNGGDVVMSIVGPTIGNALEAAFGNAVEAKTSRQVSHSALFGPGQKTVNGQYRLACNLHPTTLDEVAKDAWNKLTPW
jgi:hypothetical protein